MPGRAFRRVVVLAFAASFTWANAQPAPAVVPQHRALVVGVNKYIISNIDELLFAERDAKKLVEELERTNKFIVHRLTNTDATRSRVIQELVWFAQHVHEQDTFVLYYAGHGVPSHVANNQTLWLLHTTGMETLEAEGLRLTHLLDYVRDIRAKRKLLILDHCFAGKIRLLLQGADGMAVADGLVIEEAELMEVDDLGNEFGAVRLVRDDGLVVIGASSAVAREQPDRAHGVFTAVVLDALRKDCGGVTGADCADRDEDSRVSIEEIATYVHGRFDGTPGPGQSQRPFFHPDFSFPGSGASQPAWPLLQLTRTNAQRDRVERRFRDLVDTLESHNAISRATRERCDSSIRQWRSTLDQLAPTDRMNLSQEDEVILQTLSGLTELINDDMTQPMVDFGEMGRAVDAAVARGGGIQ